MLVSIPSLVLLAAIVLPPTLAVFGLSTFRIELGKNEIVRNVGLFNYLTRLPADQDVLDAIPRTLVFAGLSTVSCSCDDASIHVPPTYADCSNRLAHLSCMSFAPVD